MVLQISILGLMGKMGQQVANLAQKDPRYQVVGGSVRANSKHSLSINSQFPFPVTPSAEDALKECRVAIDFSSAEAAKIHIETARVLKKALVIGTTGLDQDALRSIQVASKQIPIFYSANFSLGAALCLSVVNKLSSSLFGNCYIDILETHHIHKKDSPSGTALAWAHALGKGEIVLTPSTRVRNKEQILIHPIRSGDKVGEHTIIFESGDERIKLTHEAHNRDAFAKGALAAAEFVAQQTPGLYTMNDLIS